MTHSLKPCQSLPQSLKLQTQTQTLGLDYPKTACNSVGVNGIVPREDSVKVNVLVEEDIGPQTIREGWTVGMDKEVVFGTFDVKKVVGCYVPCRSYLGLGFGSGRAWGLDGCGFSEWVAALTRLSCLGFSFSGGLIMRSDGKRSRGARRLRVQSGQYFTAMLFNN